MMSQPNWRCAWQPRINVPSCFISGGADWGTRQVPRTLECMQGTACARVAPVGLIQGADHWTQRGHLDAAVRCLLAFLGGPMQQALGAPTTKSGRKNSFRPSPSPGLPNHPCSVSADTSCAAHDHSYALPKVAYPLPREVSGTDGRMKISEERTRRPLVTGIGVLSFGKRWKCRRAAAAARGGRCCPRPQAHARAWTSEPRPRRPTSGGSRGQRIHPADLRSNASQW